MVTWFGWLLVCLFVVNSLATVSIIGKPRAPMTSGTAIWILLINGLLTMGVFAVGTGRPGY